MRSSAIRLSAVLLAVGPVFVVFALFQGTRGLTAGWLRGLVMTAVTPLYVVVGGSIVMELLIPIVAALRNGDGQVDGRAAMALVLIAFVHCALMALIGKVTATSVSAWSVFGLSRPNSEADDATRAAAAARGADVAPVAAPLLPASARSGARMAPAAAISAESAVGTESVPAPSSMRRTVVVQGTPSAAAPIPPLAGRRARGIGSRFQSRTPPH